MKMHHFLKLAVFVSATVLAITASPVKVTSLETSIQVKEPTKKETTDSALVGENQDLSASVTDNSKLIKKSDESLVVNDILNKLDKADITKIVEEEATKIKNDNLKPKLTEVSIEAVDDGKKITETSVKADDDSIKIDDTSKNSVKFTIGNLDSKVENVEINSNIDKQLRDVASAVAEAVTNLPIPIKPDSSPSKYTEIIGHFISEMLQIPMVLLHAVSNAIASLTNNKVNIPTPSFLSHTTSPPP